MFLAIFIYALLATTFITGKLALQHTNPVFLIGIRMSLAGALLLGYLWQFAREKLVFHRRDWFLFIQIVCFHVYITYLAEFYGLQYASPAKVALLFNLAPILTALLDYLLHHKKINLTQIVGLIVGFVSFFPVLTEPAAAAETAAGSLGALSFAEIAIFLAVVTAAYAWLVMEKLVVGRQYSPIFVNGFGMLFGGLLALGTAYFIGGWEVHNAQLGNWTTFSPWVPLAVWTLALIIMSNIIFYNIYGWLLLHYSPTLLSFTGLTTPLFAALFQWMVFHEPVSQGFWVSTLGISFGLWLYYKEELKTGKPS